MISSPYFNYVCKSCQDKNDTNNELLKKINEIHQSVCIKKTYASVASPSNEISLINNSILKISKSLDQNTDIVIDNLLDSDRNDDKLKELVNKLLTTSNLKPDSIIKLKPVSNKKIICTFKDTTSASSFLSSRQTLKSKFPELNKAFIRPSLDSNDMRRHKILYHAVKNNLIESTKTIKCVFNYFSNTFELRYFLNSKIDWHTSFDYSCYEEWNISYNKYISSIKTSSN